MRKDSPNATRSFPRQQAVTARFTNGSPRSFAVAGDGSRVAFVRSPAGDHPRTSLWVLDVESARERLVADPAAILADADEQLPAAERARRERTREAGSGIVGYSGDADLRRAAFALGGRLFLADLEDGGVVELQAQGPVMVPELDPTGVTVAYVTDGDLRVTSAAGGDRRLAGDDDPDVVWGVAEFVAAEEMDRYRGMWWSPDGLALLAARVDNRPIGMWHIANPADPAAEPQTIRYPAAGTNNAIVTLHLLWPGGRAVDVAWDRERFPYVLRAGWDAHGPLIAVMSRDQRQVQVLAVDPGTGLTTILFEDEDDIWLELPPGVPSRLDDGRLVITVARDGFRRVAIDGEPVTPDGLHVMDVIDAGTDLLIAATTEQKERHLYRLTPPGDLEHLTTTAGVHAGVGRGRVLVLSSATMDRFGSSVTVLRDGTVVAPIASNAATPIVEPRVQFLSAGPRKIRTAVLLPGDHRRGQSLPVLLDPYGGPHFGRVLTARNAYLESQWWADQGFAVVVADGRGTPARSIEWEQAVYLDMADVVLEDQLEALRAAAAANSDLDLSRVGIRGWSFGGYLAALAVLRAPDAVHAAVAGAPVTDERLYDTFYTERYLGHPDERPEVYERNSPLTDAASLRRPLLLIHGLADDNVVSAHTLRMSTALLEAGRPHEVLPLTGITHMTSRAAVAENLLLFQLDFLTRALAP
jgi:dipeptidyl-peptidase 4